MTLITIKIDSITDEERIMDFTKRFCNENFTKLAEIEVRGKDKILKYNKK